MSELAIDEQTRAALGRLTAGEKECLRRRLRHQTAKEMALDLGISPHAVEKRLKMARAKLGLSSSLEVARLLAASGEYRETGPQASDLERVREVRKAWLTKPKLVGVTSMTILAAAALAFLVQGQSGGTIDNPAYDEVADNPGERRSIQDLEFVKASPERVEAYVRQMFDNWDRDGSGYVEKAEAPEWLSVPKAGRLAPGELPEYIELEGDAARAQYIENVDKDDDGKVSYDEYAGPVRPQYLERGIPLIPADWTGAPANRKENAGSASNEPADGEAMPSGHVAPSEAEIVLMNQMTFHNTDADNSGYIDGSESPLRPSPGPQPVYRRDADGNFVPSGERAVRTVDEIQAQFRQMADRDGDGRISFAEFHRWSAPNLVRRGIPAAWREDMRHLISPEG